MAVTIREMKREDAQAVYRLERRLFSDPWTMKSLEDSFLFPSYKNFAAEENGVLVGYLLFMQAVDEGELLRIGVSPSCQKKGIGSLLMASMTAYAADNAISRIFLEVRENNRPARNLYEKDGFSCIGVRKRYYHDPVEDAVIMEKQIPIMF